MMKKMAGCFGFVVAGFWFVLIDLKGLGGKGIPCLHVV